ncbi:NAD(P)(+) transhydrogenase (Re/Si-specific) subunit beta [Chitinivibrio alkaliphilus]|uniref:NAD(P) transhydrogenase subunit beta n=1 Tax=Chitinivibrio alkaliphilus ACht1 TaxID=1313304 RepID=U7DAJ4_9BACT|nr:NAD(P)(+) transhydrogenase (Re/Si-specific) subunit beta [Chitinivibrio alkaliphilus]ERP39052.1 NAD(P) transhydrogenase subunit beta [Chitinivibrio alkaliphilus ACht1]
MTTQELFRIIVDGGYLLAVILFIVGLKGLTSPKSAVRGNIIGALGMLTALLCAGVDAFVQLQPADTSAVGAPTITLWLGGTLVVGLAAGAILAVKIDFKEMPQLVGLLNGFGGIASVLVAAATLLIVTTMGENETVVSALATALTGIIGGVTFTGSLIASGKLKGVVSDKPLRYGGEQVVKSVVVIALLSLALFFVLDISGVERNFLFWILVGGSAVLGLLLTLPIGGADMPIVIALLNSYSGLAAAATGFVLMPPNTVLIVGGSLVGASGIILTKLMCKAMNRSLANVLFGGMGAVVEAANEDEVYEGKIKQTAADEVASLLKIARRVVVVPGYGMAVGRAVTPVRQLYEALETEGCTVEFGIHPVAGRMPGHMNVLLAEESIPYDKLVEMDRINGSFSNTDVVLVIGANDVVNPVARESGTPISGMPILDVDQAATVIVVKRSLSPGFAGIPNPLFAADNTLMFFSDAKAAMEEVLQAYKEV